MSGLELQHRWPSLCAMAELHWLAGRREEGRQLLAGPFAESLLTDSSWARGELGFWLWRLDGLAQPPDGLAPPYALQIAGEWSAAAAAWADIGCPYERLSRCATATTPRSRRGWISSMRSVRVRPRRSCARGCGPRTERCPVDASPSPGRTRTV